KAYGALVNQEVLTRRMVMAGGSLTAAAAAGNDDVGNESDPNKPPSITIDPVQPLTAPAPVTLTAAVSDDGVGAPPGATTRKTMRVVWSLYRAPTAAAFERSGNENDAQLAPTAGKPRRCSRSKRREPMAIA